MDNVDLSGFCLDLLDLCRIDFSVDCPAGCWGEVGAIRHPVPGRANFRRDFFRGSVFVIMTILRGTILSSGAPPFSKFPLKSCAPELKLCQITL